MENSKILLQRAKLSISEANIKEWTVGGGTVLAQRYEHRISKDIDIFLQDGQLLGLLSPRFNPESENALDYDEDAQYVSLTYPEGKVDFILSGQITKFEPHEEMFFGEKVKLEDSVEIIAKKIYFRGAYVLPRDIFDLAVVYSSDRKSDVIKAAASMPEKTKIFQDEFEKLQHNAKFTPYSEEYSDALLKNGVKIKGKEMAICSIFFIDVQNYIKENTHQQPVQANFRVELPKKDDDLQR